MCPAEQAAERVYARPPHFAVHYRAGRRLRWSTEARADYSALLLLEGEMRWRVSKSDSESAGAASASEETEGAEQAGSSGEITTGAALFAAPGDALLAWGAGRAELVVVTISPVFVLDSAARARLTRSDSVVTFRARAIESDERLARLARGLGEGVFGEEG